MHSRYPRVFSPIELGPVEIPNRFYFSPHGVALTVGTQTIRPIWSAMT